MFHELFLCTRIHCIGSPTLGEHFNPAKDCSDIVDNIPGAKDGFYCIESITGKLLKVNLIINIQDAPITKGLESF